MLLYCIVISGIFCVAGKNNVVGKYKVLVLAQKSPISTYYELRKEWPTTKINQGNCGLSENACKALLEPNRWIVHGLWPVRRSGSSPRDCIWNFVQEYNNSLIDPILWQNLEKQWPQLITDKPNGSLWAYEWRKHGSCSTDIKSIKTVPLYFNKTLELLNKYNIGSVLEKHEIIPGNSYGLDQLYTVVKNNFQIQPSLKCFTDEKFELYKLDKGPPTSAQLTDDVATQLLKNMIYLRRMENKGADMYRAKLINGFCHLYSGQEAVAVGMKSAMQEPDCVLTGYRCHAFAAMFGSTARMVFAELLGRKTGSSKGKGGSMHMYGPKFYGGEGIVGGQVPIGTGLAFAQKYNNTGGVSFTLYGDGAASQGQIFEAWNLAKLWSLPAIYICENNKYGMGTAIHRHSANHQFYTRGDLIPGIKVDGMKVEEVREASLFARDHAVKEGPIIMEMVTYRYFGHSMSDPGTGYRTREEVKAVQDKEDPIKNFKALLIEKNLKTKEEVEAIQKSTYQDVDKQAEEAKNDPWPEIPELATEVYAKKLEKIRGMIPWQLY